MDSNYILTPTGNFMSEDELYHHGIVGMKWGIRRYQNADGSLTAAGEKRYTNSDGSLNEKGKKYYAKESARLRAERKSLNAQKRTAAQLSKLNDKRKANEELKNQINSKSKKENSGKKSVKDMTDDELNKAVTRARQEDEYKRLRPEPVNAAEVKAKAKSDAAKKLMSKVVNEMLIPAVISSGRNALQKALDKQMNDLLKDKVDPNSKEALQKTYDKLKLQNDIEKLKRGSSSMDDLSKEYTLRKNLMKDAGMDNAKQTEEAQKLLKKLGWSDD